MNSYRRRPHVRCIDDEDQGDQKDPEDEDVHGMNLTGRLRARKFLVQRSKKSLMLNNQMKLFIEILLLNRFFALS